MSGVGLGLRGCGFDTYELLYCNRVTICTTHDEMDQIKDRRERKKKTKTRLESKLRKKEMRYVVATRCTSCCLVFQKPSCSSIAGQW